VGTNAENLLGNKDKVLACSSPTGPAFEGAQISSGQRAAPGAIERVKIDPVTKDVKFQVIGSELWSDEDGFSESIISSGITGICGSGIIEMVAEMRIAGIVDGPGLIGSPEQTGTERCFLDGRTYSFMVHDGSATGEATITVTNRDIREIQMAKAALYSGARLLMDKFDIERVDRVVLAGAFGAHISPLHAMVLGMIPDCDIDKVTSAGNAAGTGARIALLNTVARGEIEQTVRDIHKIETAIEPRFQEHFVNASAIPNTARRITRGDQHHLFDRTLSLSLSAMTPTTQHDPSDEARAYFVLRRGVGFLGITFPIVVIVLGLFDQSANLVEPSLSAYFRTPIRDFFVGGLITIGLFLIGYSQTRLDSLSNRERWFAGVAGLCAILVAVFPSQDADCRIEGLCSITQRLLPELALQAVHYVAAIVFLTLLALISILEFCEDRAQGTCQRDENHGTSSPYSR